ncbi:lactosylceramide 4-alpha-galactosyltransferase-like [Eriocheir sinensis]|uniref:lactosylceramide 4-alpha-galactosyltransferase-like n=1 Tax=Eriocheir sinensis TaxID=95602 RepID=UPI0021C9487B|nr:lactosylceramide 4-alpha-galactosyltransferase-like [Eriocheir sinensis]
MILVPLLKRLSRNLRRCFAFVLVFLGSLVTLQILSRHTQIPEILPEAQKIVKSLLLIPLPRLSRHPREGKMTKAIASGVKEGNLSSWVQHLCPHYHADEMKVKGHTRLTFEMPTEETIFFTQTSCRTSPSPREACAVESAARHHPRRPILLLLTSPFLDHAHPLTEVLTSLPRVKMAWLDLDAIFSRSPLSAWHSDRLWMLNKERASAFISDAVRSEVLRVHGGTYVDLDALTLRPLPSHTPPRPWVTRVEPGLFNIGVSAFPKRHPFMERVVAEIPSAFDDFKALSIGPELVSKHLLQLCANQKDETARRSKRAAKFDKTEEEEEKPEDCQGVTIYPPSLFYPLHFKYDDLPRLVREEEGYGAAFLNASHAYSLHLFNSLSRRALVHPNGHSILAEAFRRNCPRIHAVASARNTYI